MQLGGRELLGSIPDMGVLGRRKKANSRKNDTGPHFRICLIQTSNDIDRTKTVRTETDHQAYKWTATDNLGWCGPLGKVGGGPQRVWTYKLVPGEKWRIVGSLCITIDERTFISVWGNLILFLCRTKAIRREGNI